MKKQLLLILLFTFSVSFAQDFNEEWRAVVQFELDGKIASASKSVDDIYKKAKRKNSEDQIIKCFFYQSKFLSIREENYQEMILQNLRGEIRASKTSKKALLNYIYVTILTNYYRNNRYIIDNRTDLKNNTSDDFKSWTSKHFEKEIDKIYSSLLEDEKQLHQIPITMFSSIFEVSPYTDSKKWSVYDFLHYKSLQYYFIDFNNLGKKNDLKIIPNLLANANEFGKLNADTISNKKLKNIIRLFQNKELHVLKSNPKEMHSLQYERMRWFARYVMDKEFYFSQLALLKEQVTDSYLKQDIQVDFANYYYKLTTPESLKNYYPEVLLIVDSVLKQKKNPNAKASAETIKEKILKKSISLNLEDTFYPFQNYRTFVTHKNVDTLKASYYKIPVSVFKKLEQNNYYYRNPKANNADRDSLVLTFIEQNLPIKTALKILPHQIDYFEHTTEVLMDPLDRGQYIIFFETKNSFYNSQRAFAYKVIQVSDINFIQQQNKDYDTFNLLDRKTGKPIANATLQNDNSIVKSDKTGKAFFKLTTQKTDLYTELLLINNKDTLSTSYNKTSESDLFPDENFNAKATLFFDRAIYRPGQKVYFKGFIFQNKNKIKSVVSNLTVQITVEDANDAELKTFELKTNEFGSFIGEYDIPKNVLTGSFNIKIEEPIDEKVDATYYNSDTKDHLFWDKVSFENNQKFSFQVEEYKRPTFEITFDKITENYTIGDSILLKGNAKTLAGSNLTNAKVTYTLSKNVVLKKLYADVNSPNYSGETTTDDKGNFEIKFIALNDSITNDEIKSISYNLQTAITDLNGETRTQSLNLKVGQEMLKLNCKIAPKLLKENKNTFEILATTLNNFPLKVKGTITLIEQNRKDFLIKKEVFPESNAIEKEEYKKLFPHEAYDKNDLQVSEKEVLTVSFDTEKSTVVDLVFLRNFKLTQYKIILKAQDQKGNEIQSEETFELNSRIKKASEKALFTYSQIESDKNNFVFEIKSIIPDLYITTKMFDGLNQKSELVTQLKNGVGVVKILRKAYYENDVHFHFSTFWENIYLDEQFTVYKEDTSTHLDFEIVRMRNKIEPGSLENWSFILKNSKLQSEILASMYDSSLDQFATSDWKIPKFDTRKHVPIVIYKRNYWHYNTINFNNLYYKLNYYKVLNSNPELNWFGFSFNERNKYVNEQYLKSVKYIASIPRNAKILEGLVTNAGEGDALMGVYVTVQGTNRAAITDFDGRFKIEVQKGEIIAFSYIGSKTVMVPVDKERFLTVTLEDDEINLEEVLVQGYRNIKRSEILNSSITTAANANLSLLESIQSQAQGVRLNFNSGRPGGSLTLTIRGQSSLNEGEDPLYVIDGEILTLDQFRNLKPNDIQTVSVLKDASASAIYGSKGANGVIIITTKNAIKELQQVKTRTNFNETAFFYPSLTADSKGNINFSFTTPESLTRWRLRLFGHTKKAETGYFQTDIISQKDLMVMPNMPRFVREKDVIQFSSKVVNMTNETKSGTAILLLFDASTNTAIDSITMNSKNVKTFNCKAKETVSVNWTVTIPEGVQGLRYKVIAKSGTVSDGEENILAVLTDKILITESIPIWVKANTKREFTLENLKNNTSTTLQNHAVTFEYTSNPVWIALQSLPYLMTYENECSEQVFAKYYANCIAEKIIASNPKIENLFKKWHDDKSVSSKLQMNEELKSIVLAETPWLLDTESDSEKNKRLAILMDLNTLKENNSATFKKLEDKMLPTGGFPWFSGGTENRFISQHILNGIGHLLASFPEDSLKYKTMVSKGIPNLDRKFAIKYSPKAKIIRPSTLDLNYLYTRSFYLKNNPLSTQTDSIIQLQLKQCKTDWLSYSLYEKGLLALIMNRFNEKDFAKKVITSLKETVSNNNEIGMYWIENNSSYGWYQSQIATQALLIEAFAEMEDNKETIDAMKVWLIKNKQTNRWSSTKSTTEAVYALMSQGSDWTSLKENTKIKIGDEKMFTQKISDKDDEQNAGYLKIRYNSEEINPKMATISVNNKSHVPGFGGLYWQYFESLENIKKDPIQTISIDKKIFKKVNTSKREQLVAISDNTLKIGDLVTVRLIVKTETDLEFMHLKDLRASGLEPVEVLSKYEWKGNFSYYKSTKDVSTNYFFDRLQKGTYVLEYDLRVTNQGNFNSGISTLQSIYTPEFSAHSENTKVIVKE